MEGQENKRALAIFSRYPIQEIETKYFGNKSNGFQSVDLQLDGQKVRLLNIHLQTNAISVMADKVASEGNLQEKETWLNIRGIMGRYRRSARKRATQAKEIAGHINQSPYPTLVCGDFNDVPQSYTYYTVSSGLQDAFKRKGRGLGITYAGKIPGLRIDYILANHQFKILDHRILDSNFSDHYPVKSVVLLDQP